MSSVTPGGGNPWENIGLSNDNVVKLKSESGKEHNIGILFVKNPKDNAETIDKVKKEIAHVLENNPTAESFVEKFRDHSNVRLLLRDETDSDLTEEEFLEGKPMEVDVVFKNGPEAYRLKCVEPRDGVMEKLNEILDKEYENEEDFLKAMGSLEEVEILPELNIQDFFKNQDNG